MILAEAPQDRDDVSLLVDVGTNAEIVLGNRERLLAASSPTGPAFEGAQISAGQRAAPGAIERVRIDRATFEPRVRVIGGEAWSDEPGFDASHVTGICGSGIIEAIAELFLAGVLTADGVVDGSLADRTTRVIADGRTFSLRPVRRPPDRDHAERRAADPAGEGGAVRGLPAADGRVRRGARSTGSAWPARSARTSTRSTRWCWGSCPTASRRT